MRILATSILLISVIFLNCLKKESDYDDKYATTILLQLISTDSNAQATCVGLFKKQTECVTTQAAAAAAKFGLTLPVTPDSTYETQCTDSRKSAAYNTMSDMSQTCVFTCQDTDWKTKISSGECKTATTQSLVQSSLNNETVKKCIASCFQTTNNKISDADITKLLIFNFIQNGD